MFLPGRSQSHAFIPFLLLRLGRAFSPTTPPSRAHDVIAVLAASSSQFCPSYTSHRHHCSMAKKPNEVRTNLRRSTRLSQARGSIEKNEPKPAPKKSAGKRKQTRDITDISSSKESSTDYSPQDGPNLLLDLGPLIMGKLIKRPSATVKSPYVSDVMIIGENGEEGDIVLAHSPALDVGGLCVPNTTVFMSVRPPGGKTSHSIELVLAPAPNCLTVDHDSGILVGAHPQLGEKLAESVLQKGLLQDVIGYGEARLDTSKRSSTKKNKKQDVEHEEDGVVLRRQCTYGDSRVDFELIDHSKKAEAKSLSLIEVKNVVCSDVAATLAPEKTGPNHCVIISEKKDYSRTAIFPWGRIGQTFKGKKVVSERAIKHLRNLGNLTATDNNINAIVLFVINRSDCEGFRACHEQCPMFAAELKAASEKGCTVTSFRVRWTREGKAYFDGIMPVAL